MVCFQALIKAYGRKRLREIEEHRRQRDKAAKIKAESTPNSHDCSPVHKMVNSSADLLQRVMKLGRKQSISADNISVLGKTNKPLLCENNLSVGSLLQKVIALGKQSKDPSMLDGLNEWNKMTSPTEDALCPENGGNSPFRVTQEEEGPVKPPSGEKTSPKKRWGLVKGTADGQQRSTNHQGNKYQAVQTEESYVAVGSNAEVTSPDQTTVNMETEESDLETTEATPDREDDPEDSLVVGGEIQPPQSRCFNLKRGPPWRARGDPRFSAKSVSFDNPVYSEAPANPHSDCLHKSHSQEAICIPEHFGNGNRQGLHQGSGQVSVSPVTAVASDTCTQPTEGQLTSALESQIRPTTNVLHLPKVDQSLSNDQTRDHDVSNRWTIIT